MEVCGESEPGVRTIWPEHHKCKREKGHSGRHYCRKCKVFFDVQK